MGSPLTAGQLVGHTGAPLTEIFLAETTLIALSIVRSGNPPAGSRFPKRLSLPRTVVAPELFLGWRERCIKFEFGSASLQYLSPLLTYPYS
jgi:hypothetical protein